MTGPRGRGILQGMEIIKELKREVPLPGLSLVPETRVKRAGL